MHEFKWNVIIFKLDVFFYSPWTYPLKGRNASISFIIRCLLDEESPFPDLCVFFTNIPHFPSLQSQASEPRKWVSRGKTCSYSPKSNPWKRCPLSLVLLPHHHLMSSLSPLTLLLLLRISIADKHWPAKLPLTPSLLALLLPVHFILLLDYSLLRSFKYLHDPGMFWRTAMLTSSCWAPTMHQALDWHFLTFFSSTSWNSLCYSISQMRKQRLLEDKSTGQDHKAYKPWSGN